MVVAALAAIAFTFSQLSGRRDPQKWSAHAGQMSGTSTQAVSETLAPTDWPQFRGPEGSGASIDATIPLEWSDTKNLSWKTRLPGPGSSSPIVVGDRVFVTCYSGYGTEDARSGDIRELKRHLVCLNRIDGNVAWTVDVAAVVPEDRFHGYLTEHGYASHTPVSDGEAVYAFFGKSGLVAYDLAGTQLWRTSLGTRSDGRRWGSASSPVLYKNLVIVNAASESRSIWALDKKTGQQVWKAPTKSLDLSFGTPTLGKLPDGRTELALCVPGELWGLDPDKGTLNWYATVPMTGNVSPSVAAHGGIIYATGGFRGKGTVAVAAGGDGDVTDTHVRWSVRQSSYVASPVLHDGHLYWVDDKGIAVCLNATTGETQYRERLALSGGSGRPVYASPVLAGDRLIVVTRRAGTVILAARPKYELITTNTLNDESDFNATPAVSRDQLFLRSNRAIYCISARSDGPGAAG